MNVVFVAAMIQFPPGFQGTNLSGFSGAAANFGTFRPQFSVPGQPSNFTSSTSQVINRRFDFFVQMKIKFVKLFSVNF